MQYAVYVIVTEDSEEADLRVGDGSFESVERVQGDLTIEDAELLASQIAADA